MRDSLFNLLFSRPFPNSSCLLGSVSLAASVRAFHAIPDEVSSDQISSPSVTEKKLDHLHYMNDFCTLIRILSINSRNYGALRDLDSLLTRTHYLDSATSVYVIDGLCRLKKLGRAKTVIWSLKNKGNVSDYFLYSLVIQCLVKDGSIDDVESVWNEVSGSESPSIHGIDASDFVIYLCKFGEVLEIEWICRRVLMGGWVLEQQSYIALIGALCRENRDLLVKEVLHEMKNKGFKPDSLIYFTVFQCFCRNGDLEEADSILRKLIKRNYSIDICIYGSFIYGLCRSGKLREADKLFDRLVKRDSSGVSDIMFLKHGRRVIFQLNCKGAVPEIMAYETYFRSLCCVGRLDKAEILLKKMMRKRAVPEVCVYSAFIKSLFRAGRASDALRFFNVERKKGFVPLEEIAKSVIFGLCEIGEVDNAWIIFDETVMKGGFVVATSICNCFLGSYWKVERLAEVVKLFERMQNGSFGGPDISTYMIMVSGYFNHGKFSKALHLFEEMMNNKVPVSGALYEVIIRGLCESAKLEEAHECLSKMIESGHLVSYYRWRLLFESFFITNGHGLSLGF